MDAPICLLSWAKVVKDPALDELRCLLSERLGIQEAILCGSGSLALEIALRSCGMGRGDEVVIPAFCCSAIVPPLLAVGIIPVLADVGPELNLTVETVAQALTRKTTAVVVPHLFGNPAEIEPIVELCRSKKVSVIDDAAQALGAASGGRSAGSFGDAGIVSFGEGKICAALGGGAVMSNRPGLLHRSCRWMAQPQPGAVLRRPSSAQFKRHGRRRNVPRGEVRGGVAPDALPRRYAKTGMTTLQAAVAAAMMRKLEENIAARRERVNAYRDFLGQETALDLIPHRPGSACLAQVVRVLPVKRGEDAAWKVVKTLARYGHEIHGSYVPIHLLNGFEKCVWDRLPFSERIWSNLIELPCDPDVSIKDVEEISALVKVAAGARAG